MSRDLLVQVAYNLANARNELVESIKMATF